MHPQMLVIEYVGSISSLGDTQSIRDRNETDRQMRALSLFPELHVWKEIIKYAE